MTTATASTTAVKIDINDLTERMAKKREQLNRQKDNAFEKLVDETKSNIDYINNNILNQAKTVLQVLNNMTGYKLYGGFELFNREKQPAAVGFLKIVRSWGVDSTIAVWMKDENGYHETIFIGIDQKKLQFRTTGGDIGFECSVKSCDALEWLRYHNDQKHWYMIHMYNKCLKTLIKGFDEFRNAYLASVEARLK